MGIVQICAYIFQGLPFLFNLFNYNFKTKYLSTFLKSAFLMSKIQNDFSAVKLVVGNLNPIIIFSKTFFAHLLIPVS